MTKKSKYWKHPKFGHVYINNEALSTPLVRVAWPALKSARADSTNDKGETIKGKYELVFVLPKKNADVKNLNKAVQAMTKGMLELYNKGNPAKLATCESFKDGDAFDHEKYPYYKNSWILLARNNNEPSMIGKKKDKNGKFEKVDPKLVQGGTLCRGIVTPIVSAKGISFQLISVQLVEDDGTRYGGGAPAAESYHKLFEEGSADEDSEDDVDSDDEGSDDDGEDAESDADDEEGDSESEEEDSEDDSEEDDDSEDDSEEEESEDDEEEEELPKAAKAAKVKGAKKGKQLALDQI